MMTLGWLLWAAWLGSADAQFNDTYRLTLTSADGMCDFDGASKAVFDGEPFTLDAGTGFRTSAGRSSGHSGVWFVATGVSVHGRASWKTDPGDGSSPSYAFLYRTNEEWRSVLDTDRNYNVSADTNPLLNASGLDLASYELRFSFQSAAQLEFHNMTIDVPIKTQA